MAKRLSVVVSGNVDSGKTTLIGRLLHDTGSLHDGAMREVEDACREIGSGLEFAYLLDSFEEERKGEFTMDTTQVFCKDNHGGEFVMIDVPGHEELLKNMLSGSSYADLAILVIDMNKPIEDQTRRHAFILDFLDIKPIVVVLNKMDSVGFQEAGFNSVSREVLSVLGKIGINPSCVIPASARDGDNLVKRSAEMKWYKGISVLDSVRLCPQRKPQARLRFTVQDIYHLGADTFAVGDVMSGVIKKGDLVHVLPGMFTRRVKKIRILERLVKRAGFPCGAGIILDDMSGIKRGQVFSLPPLPEVKREFLSRIICVSEFDLKGKLRLGCSTQSTFAGITRVNEVRDMASLELAPDKGMIRKNDFAELMFTTDEPLVVDSSLNRNNLSKFVLKNEEGKICAVGNIIPAKK